MLNALLGTTTAFILIACGLFFYPKDPPVHSILDPITGNYVYYMDDAVKSNLDLLNLQEYLNSLHGQHAYIDIDGYGGDVTIGHKMFELIRNYSGGTTLYVLDSAYSMNADFACASSDVRLSKYASLMFHYAQLSDSVGKQYTAKPDDLLPSQSAVVDGLLRDYCSKYITPNDMDGIKNHLLQVFIFADGHKEYRIAKS